MRTEVIDPNHYIEIYTAAGAEKRAVTVTWHNRLLFFPVMFKAKTRKRAVAVISASRDGQYIADLCKQFGVNSVRGSSRQRAVSVLRDAIKSVSNGSLICFTPDGPRGPAYEMSKGPIHIASVLGVPVIPVSVNYSSYWELNSWDRFRIPKPWAKITLVVGDEHYIPQNINADDLEKWRKTLQNDLNAISNVSSAS